MAAAATTRTTTFDRKRGGGEEEEESKERKRGSSKTKNCFSLLEQENVVQTFSGYLLEWRSYSSLAGEREERGPYSHLSPVLYSLPGRRGSRRRSTTGEFFFPLSPRSSFFLTFFFLLNSPASIAEPERRHEGSCISPCPLLSNAQRFPPSLSRSWHGRSGGACGAWWEARKKEAAVAARRRPPDS